MWKDKQEVIRKILKYPPLYGNPFTTMSYQGWEWDEPVMQMMGENDLLNLLSYLESQGEIS